MTMADAMVKATTEKKDVTFHAQVVLVKHIPNTYGTMTALMCGAQLNDGRTCRRSVMLNQSCKNGHAPHLQTLGHDKDTRYEFKVCARDLSASDEAASFSVVLVLFDNCMLTLTEGIPAKTMRGLTESEKSNFIKHIVGLDAAYDIVARATKSGYMDLKMISDDAINTNRLAMAFAEPC